MKAKKWTEPGLREAVVGARSIREILEKLGLVPAGGNYATIQRYVKRLGPDDSHLKGRAWNKGMRVITNPPRPLGEVLRRGVVYKSYDLKGRLFAAGLKPRYCEECG